jgi:gluconolactonase
MKFFLSLAFLFLVFCMPKAQAAELYVSEVLTAKGLFPRGIEGPAVDPKGNLYVVNFGKKGTIGIIRPNQAPQLWLTLPEGSVGNSIRFNKDGRMFVADYKEHKVFSIDIVSKKIELLFQKKEMNQPNDMAISSKNVIYLSDPNWRQHKKGCIWIYKDGKVQKAADRLAAVNGIDLNPAESNVYFSESISGSIFSMEIKTDALQNKKLFYKFEPDTVDGIRFDSSGNLFVARILKGKIDVLSPKGNLIRSVPLNGKDPTNLAFGGPDGKTVYVTLRDKGYIESFRTETPGREHFWAK